MPKLIHCRWLLLGLLPLVTLAQGQENAPNPQLLSDTDTWTSPRYALQVTPYAWVTGLSGESSPFKRAPTLDIEKSFSDVFHDLRAAAFINTWARHDRYVLNSDLLYVNTRVSEVVGGLPFVGAGEGGLVDGRPGPPVPRRARRANLITSRPRPHDRRTGIRPRPDCARGSRTPVGRLRLHRSAVKSKR